MPCESCSCRNQGSPAASQWRSNDEIALLMLQCVRPIGSHSWPTDAWGHGQHHTIGETWNVRVLQMHCDVQWVGTISEGLNSKSRVRILLRHAAKDTRINKRLRGVDLSGLSNTFLSESGTRRSSAILQTPTVVNCRRRFGLEVWSSNQSM